MAGSIPKAYFKYGLLAGLGLGALIEYDNLDILYNTFGRDVKTIAMYARILLEYRKLQRLNKTVPDYFYETVQKHGDKVRKKFFKNISFAFVCFGDSATFYITSCSTV